MSLLYVESRQGQSVSWTARVPRVTGDLEEAEGKALVRGTRSG
jgi:hypothetical protein